MNFSLGNFNIRLVIFDKFGIKIRFKITKLTWIRQRNKK